MNKLLHIRNSGFSILFSLVMLSCGQKRLASDGPGTGNYEIREDSVTMAEALLDQARFKNHLTADGETDPVRSAQGEDAADDPAIWYNPDYPGKSLIIGTNKTAGLQVYDIEGNTLQLINAGKINNVDLRDGFMLGGREVAIVAGSNRTNNCITLFYIDPDLGVLSDSIINIPSGVDTVYGICMFKDPKASDFYVFLNGKGGKVEQWKLKSAGTGINAIKIREFSVESQPEGMVADDKNSKLYVGVEEEGIFQYDADAGSDLTAGKIMGSDSLNPNIKYDIEGLALFEVNDQTYLMASIQGNSSYAIFDLQNNSYLTSFIIADGACDGTEDTDGIDILQKQLSSMFPEGILVVQDGFNKNNGEMENQNFKIISLSKIIELIK